MTPRYLERMPWVAGTLIAMYFQIVIRMGLVLKSFLSLGDVFCFAIVSCQRASNLSRELLSVWSATAEQFIPVIIRALVQL